MRCYLSGLCCAVVVLGAGGCSSDAVQEDRTIAFGPASATAFQHEAAGVFIDVGGETRQIFKPDANVIAVGSPQWSPDRRSVLFTTATSVAAQPQGAAASPEVEPDGRLLLKQAVRYTCWRYDSDAGATAKPVKLFDAVCGHAGYVGAKLAVRWARDGGSVLFVDVDKYGRHHLMRFDLQNQTTAEAFPHAVDWLVFELVPGNDQIVVCVEGKQNNGVWIGGAAKSGWRHAASVRGANRLSTRIGSLQRFLPFMASTSDSPIERLRGLMPTWTQDGSRFALISSTEVQQGQRKPSAPQTFGLHVADLDKRNVSLVVESIQRMSDVRWHPSGSSWAWCDTQRTV